MNFQFSHLEIESLLINYFLKSIYITHVKLKYNKLYIIHTMLNNISYTVY